MEFGVTGSTNTREEIEFGFPKCDPILENRPFGHNGQFSVV